MNSFLLAFLLITTKTRFGQRPHALEYNTDVLVQSSRLINECINASPSAVCGQVQDLTVAINGKQYELEGTNFSSDLLRTGSYKAGIQIDEHNHSYEYQLIYEFKFQDGRTQSYQVVREGA